MLLIGEMNIKYRTEPTLRYLIIGISILFGIPNTDVGIGIGFFSNIGYWFGIFAIPAMTSRQTDHQLAGVSE